MKKTALLGLALAALLTSACTTVTTYDRDGNKTGKCQITGLLRKGGECIGYANDTRREAR